MSDGSEAPPMTLGEAHNEIVRALSYLRPLARCEEAAAAILRETGDPIAAANRMAVLRAEIARLTPEVESLRLTQQELAQEAAERRRALDSEMKDKRRAAEDGLRVEMARARYDMDTAVAEHEAAVKATIAGLDAEVVAARQRLKDVNDKLDAAERRRSAAVAALTNR